MTYAPAQPTTGAHLHTAWDSQKSLIGTAIVAIVSLVALGWTVHRISHPRRT